MKHLSMPLLFCCVLCLTGAAILLEWLRSVNLPLPVLNNFRADLVGLCLFKSGQIVLVIGFLVWFLMLLWIKVQAGISTPGQGILKKLLLRDWCKVLLVIFSL